MGSEVEVQAASGVMDRSAGDEEVKRIENGGET